MLTQGGWFSQSVQITTPTPTSACPQPLEQFPKYATWSFRNHILWPVFPALCLAFQLFVYHNTPVEFHLFYNWLGVFGLCFQTQSCIFRSGLPVFFEQQMLVPLYRLDTLLFNFLASVSILTSRVYTWGCYHSHLQTGECIKPFWKEK